MRPLEIVYWLRMAFGFVAALVSLGFAIAVYGTPLPPRTGEDMPISIFFNSISLAIIVYLLSYYILKPRFQGKVAKVSKLLTTGIGVYFLTWIVFYVLLYTAFSGAVV